MLVFLATPSTAVGVCRQLGPTPLFSMLSGGDEKLLRSLLRDRRKEHLLFHSFYLKTS